MPEREGQQACAPLQRTGRIKRVSHGEPLDTEPWWA